LEDSDSVIDQGLEGSSPFFGLASRTWSVMEAYLHYWDVAHGKVVKTDKVVCSASVLPPITSPTNMTKAFSLVQITGGLVGLGTTLSIFGKDVEMLRVLDEKSYTKKHSLGIFLKRYNRFNHLKNLRFFRG